MRSSDDEWRSDAIVFCRREDGEGWKSVKPRNVKFRKVGPEMNPEMTRAVREESRKEWLPTASIAASTRGSIRRAME